jgi:serine/threonine protein kinase
MGTLGPVFRAQDTVAGQIVAIKAFKLDVSPELAPSIAEALRALVGQAPSVEGLVPLLDAGLEGDTPWLATEHLSCPTLDMRLREGGLLPLDEATALVRALADAVDTAHAHGLHHGSLHPRDVFLPADGGVIVSGFGVAAAIGVAGLRPPRRRPFTAPETLAQKPLDAPADRYALGVMVYEIVSGRRLLGAGDDLAAGLAARAETSDIPRAATALAAMLAERPDHRPSSATVFAQALCAALEAPPPPLAPLSAVIAAAPSRLPRSAGDPPTPEALAEFARQGTFWEPPRRGVDEGGDAATLVSGVTPAHADDDRSTVLLTPLAAELADRRVRLAPASEVELDPARDAAPDPAPEPALERTRPPAPEPRRLIVPADTLDPDLRPEPALHHVEDPLPFSTFGDSPDRTDAVTQPGASPVAPPEAGAHTPPLVVLALTLGLGLAIGAAGGYLVGHRSGERAAQRALGGETGTSSATFADTSPTAPPAATPDPSTAPPEAGDGETPRVTPADPAAAGRGEPTPEPAPAAPRGPAPAAAATGQLAIRSTPARAGVLIDGEWRGRTPLTVRDLTVGTHTVRVAEDGYVAETRRIAVDARTSPTTVSFRLARIRPVERAPAAPVRPAAKTGSLRFESRPSAAVVYLDDRLVGVTPLQVSDLAPRIYRVRFEKPGHRPWTTASTVVAGQQVRVAASLEESNER